MSGVSNRTKILLGVLVLLLVTVLWWLLILSPQRDAIDTAQAELDNSLVRESTLQTRLAQLQQIRDNELSYLFAIGQMEASIPATPQADAFIEKLTFLAERTGVELNQIALTPPVADALSGGFEVPVSVAIEGEYFEILGFLYGLEAMDRLVRVDSIGLTPLEGAEEPDSTPPPEGEGSGETAGRLRPNPDLLAADITMLIFTRGPASGSNPGPAVTVPQGSAELDDEGSGEDL